MFHLVKQVLPGTLLTACVFASGGDANAAVKSSAKLLYSNRPAGYVIPVPYYGTPSVPRFMFPAVPGGSSLNPEAAAVLAPPVPSASAVTAATPSEKTQPEKIFILREPAAETKVADEIDMMNARLAKIQLEKHQYQTALTHVQRIKSQVFKVKTIANLAEYVSRDKNYLNEYDDLYRLTVAGMEALDKNLPFDVPAGETVPGNAGGNAAGNAGGNAAENAGGNGNNAVVPLPGDPSGDGNVKEDPKQPEPPKPVTDPPATGTEPVKPPEPDPPAPPPPPDKPVTEPAEVPDPPIPPPDIPVVPPPGNPSSPEVPPPVLPNNDRSSTPLTIPPASNSDPAKKPDKKRPLKFESED